MKIKVVDYLKYIMTLQNTLHESKVFCSPPDEKHWVMEF
jgi:hypothetical protein